MRQSEAEWDGQKVKHYLNTKLPLKRVASQPYAKRGQKRPKKVTLKKANTKNKQENPKGDNRSDKLVSGVDTKSVMIEKGR